MAKKVRKPAKKPVKKSSGKPVVESAAKSVGKPAGSAAQREMLRQALVEARLGLSEGGVPVGAAVFDARGRLVSLGRDRRIQDSDSTLHAAVVAVRNAGMLTSWRDKTLVVTVAPCWLCAGLARQLRFKAVVVGESGNFSGGMAWLRRQKVAVTDLQDGECTELLANFIEANPQIWRAI